MLRHPRPQGGRLPHDKHQRRGHGRLLPRSPCLAGENPGQGIPLFSREILHRRGGSHPEVLDETGGNPQLTAWSDSGHETRTSPSMTVRPASSAGASRASAGLAPDLLVAGRVCMQPRTDKSPWSLPKGLPWLRSLHRPVKSSNVHKYLYLIELTLDWTSDLVPYRSASSS